MVQKRVNPIIRWFKENWPLVLASILFIILVIGLNPN